MTISCLFTMISLIVFTAPNISAAQNMTLVSDSTKTIVLPDVEIKGYAGQIVVSSGIESRNHGHYLGYGGGDAFHFKQPEAKYHVLRQIRFHLLDSKSIREGNLFIRVASLTPENMPADDNLLSEPIVISAEILQRSKKNFVLRLPLPGILVPENGFFVVIECKGNKGTEYTSAYAQPKSKKSIPAYVISADRTPDAPTRQVPVDHFPKLAGAKPNDESTVSWYYRDSVTQNWRNSSKDNVIFLEVSFE